MGRGAATMVTFDTVTAGATRGGRHGAVAITLTDLGTTCEEAGAMGEAEADLSQALAAFRSLGAADPGTTEYAYWASQTQRHLARLAGELGGRGTVLEPGVGTGRMALPLSAAGVDVIGLDLSEPMPGGELDAPVSGAS